MSSGNIRDLARSLKRLARSHRRSLQGELHATLGRSARMAPPEAGERNLDIMTVKLGRKNSWAWSDIYGRSAR